jgi:hypothetical protein
MGKVQDNWHELAEKYGDNLIRMARSRKWKHLHRVWGDRLGMNYREVVDWGRWLHKTWGKQPEVHPDPETREQPGGDKIEQNVRGNHLEVLSRGARIQTLDELMDAAEIDLSIWRVESWKANTWEVASKIDGDMEVTTLWQVKAHLVKIVADEQEFPQIRPVSITVDPVGFVAKRPQSGVKRCLVIPDSQNGYRRDYETGYLDPMHDRRAWDLSVQMCKHTQPDTVVMLGDMLDLADWSDKYVTSPDMYNTTQPAVLELAWWIAQVKAACPPWTEIIYLEGNHEQRMDRAILKHIPSAYGLKPAGAIINTASKPCLSVPELLGLSSLGVKYVDGYPDCEFWLTDTIKFTHGMVVRQGGGKTSSEVIKKSAVSQGFGHIHRLELSAKTTHGRDGSETVYAFSPGTICRLDGVVPGYKKKNDWQQGLGVVYYRDDSPAHRVDLIPINDGSLIWQDMILSGEDRVEELIASTGDWFSSRKRQAHGKS